MEEELPTVDDSSNNTDISLPLVTVNILSYNRQDELRHTLTKVFEQDYKNIEVIVVDNASTDGSAEMVQKEFPTVNLIQMQKNIGIAGWNEGFKIAKGEYVLVLDDDSYPEKSTITKGVQAITIEKAAIVAFDIYNKYSMEFETKNFVQNALSFIGCGALINKKTLTEIGYYNDDYFLYNNELDFSMRVLGVGEKILFLKDAIIIHEFVKKETNRTNPFLSKSRYYYFFVSQTTFIIQHFSNKDKLILLIKWIFNRLLICIIYSYWSEFISASYFIIKHYSSNKKKNKGIPDNFKKEFLKTFAWVDRNFFPNFIKPSF